MICALVTGVQTCALPISRRGQIAVSLPIERSLLPCIDKAEHQLADEHHHRDPGRPAKVEHRDRPRIEERGFQIEDDEQDSDQIEAHVELAARRSEEHTSELQSLMRISYAVLCLKKKTKKYP